MMARAQSLREADRKRDVRPVVRLKRVPATLVANTAPNAPARPNARPPQ
jgi:hypothetical protein